MVRFHVRDTFALQDKSALVLAGFIIGDDLALEIDPIKDRTVEIITMA